MEDYKQAIANLDFSLIPFEDLPMDVGEKVNTIIDAFESSKDDIILSLPLNIKIIYLIGEFESAILNDGLLSVFCNSNLIEIMRLREAIVQIHSEKLLKLFDRAKSLFEKEYTFKPNTSFIHEHPAEDGFYFFSEKIIDTMEDIEEKIDELQDSGEYWNKIEKIYGK